jgi:polygalacturonase
LVQAVPVLKSCFRDKPVLPSELPAPPVFNVRDFGAKGDGTISDTAAIQRALDTCWHAGGGIVRLPPGTYLSQPIFLRSQTTLQLDQGAGWRASDNPADFCDVRGFINGNNLTGVAITGQGTVDGAGAKWWEPVREAKRLHQPEPGSRPRLVVFSWCMYVRVEGVTLENSPSFHLVPGDCEDVDIENVTIHAPADAPNTDAIDPSASRYVRIANCVLDTGDDNIAIKSGHIDPAHPGGAAEHIIISNCTFLHGHGLSIGSETVGGVRDLTVEHCTFNGTTCGIRIKSARGRGGVVEKLVYKDVTMTNVAFPIYLTSYYPKVSKEEASETMTPTTPAYRNIRIENVIAHSSREAGAVVGLPECSITNLVFENVHITAPKGMTLRNTKAIEFKNSTIEVQSGPRLILEANAEVSGLQSK